MQNRSVYNKHRPFICKYQLTVNKLLDARMVVNGYNALPRISCFDSSTRVARKPDTEQKESVKLKLPLINSKKGRK